MTNTCATCKHYERTEAQWLDMCRRGSEFIEPVRGASVRPTLNCATERNAVTHGACGPGGRYWQPKFIAVGRAA